MDKKDKSEILQMFSKAFHEVVPPLFENVATKEDIDRLERKLDATEDRGDRQGKQLENHEKRIGRIEVKVGTPSF